MTDNRPRLKHVTVNNISVNNYVLAWEFVAEINNSVSGATITLQKSVNNVIKISRDCIGYPVTIQRGVNSPTEEWVFRGEIVNVVEKGNIYILDCSGRYYEAVRAEITHYYDKNTSPEAGIISEIFKSNINNYTNLVADDESVQSTGTELILDKFICNHTDVFERNEALAKAIGWQHYYDHETDKVRFEPFGFETDETIVLKVGENIIEVPQWESNSEEMINELTVKGAEIVVETTKFVDGTGEENQEVQLDYTPVSVKVYVGAGNYDPTGTGTKPSDNEANLKKGGKKGSTSGTYDYEYDDDPKVRKVYFKKTGESLPSLTPPVGTNNIEIRYSYKLPVPVFGRREDSISKYGLHKQTIVRTDIKSVDDAEVFLQKTLDTFSEPFLSTKLKVINTSGIKIGRTYRIIDNYNNKDKLMQVIKIKKSWPYKYDEITVSDRALRINKWEISTMDRIKRLEELQTTSEDLLLNVLPFNDELNLHYTLEIKKIDYEPLKLPVDNLEVEYLFENNLKDTSGKNNHLIPQGTITYTPGHIGYCAELTNATSENILNNLSNQLSISTWVKLYNDTTHIKISFIDASTEFEGAYLEIEKDKITWRYNNTIYYYNQTDLFDTNEFKHIIVKQDSTSEPVIYINNNEIQLSNITDDISTATYDNISFSVSSQEDWPRGIFFKPDGTKMYIVGIHNDTVYQYTLSTPWDISTATYDNISFSVSSQESYPYGIFFKSDGTKMYIVGEDTDKVYQYSLSTPWDISTATYDNINFNVHYQTDVPTGIFFKSDGTKMYIISYNNKAIYQYSLSVPWDISTATYDNISFSVSSQESYPFGMFFKLDGTKIYVVGYNNKTVYQYSLSVPWDISTATYDNISFSVSSQDSYPFGIFFKSDGTKMYILGYTNNRVYQYTLLASFDFTNAKLKLENSYIDELRIYSKILDSNEKDQLYNETINSRKLFILGHPQFGMLGRQWLGDSSGITEKTIYLYRKDGIYYHNQQIDITAGNNIILDIVKNVEDFNTIILESGNISGDYNLYYSIDDGDTWVACDFETINLLNPANSLKIKIEANTTNVTITPVYDEFGRIDIHAIKVKII